MRLSIEVLGLVAGTLSSVAIGAMVGGCRSLESSAQASQAGAPVVIAPVRSNHPAGAPLRPVMQPMQLTQPLPPMAPVPLGVVEPPPIVTVSQNPPDVPEDEVILAEAEDGNDPSEDQQARRERRRRRAEQEQISRQYEIHPACGRG